MKVNRRALYGALQILNKVADHKSSALALGYTKLEAENGILKLTATDLDRTLSTTIPVDGDLETLLPC
jgi:DNA polymerase III sliding clamp (beta) subunit (PCNA family)